MKRSIVVLSLLIVFVALPAAAQQESTPSPPTSVDLRTLGQALNCLIIIESALGAAETREEVLRIQATGMTCIRPLIEALGDADLSRLFSTLEPFSLAAADWLKKQTAADEAKRKLLGIFGDAAQQAREIETSLAPGKSFHAMLVSDLREALEATISDLNLTSECPPPQP